ncbi:hypothetical protein BDW69DRAFT_163183 [Aspergillus filifer]
MVREASRVALGGTRELLISRTWCFTTCIPCRRPCNSWTDVLGSRSSILEVAWAARMLGAGCTSNLGGLAGGDTPDSACQQMGAHHAVVRYGLASQKKESNGSGEMSLEEFLRSCNGAWPWGRLALLGRILLGLVCSSPQLLPPCFFWLDCRFAAEGSGVGRLC